MRTINENMHVWTLNEVLDGEVGVKGTAARAEFDASVEKEVREIKAHEQEEKASMHIVVPVYVRDAIRRNAAALGESANAYVNNLFSQAIANTVYA